MAKIVSFVRSGVEGFGVLDASLQRVLDFTSIDLSRYGAADPVGSVMGLVEMGDTGADLANAAVSDEDRWPADAIVSLREVALRPPLPRPLTVRDFVSFEKHLLQCARRHLGDDRWRPPEIWYQRPIYYRGNPLSFVGHGANVHTPSRTEEFDYELELGFVIGKAGRDIPVENAMDHVFGLTIFNDFTARDVQREDAAIQLGPCFSKDFDTCNAMGPWLVTRDEISDPASLEMSVRVNGEQMGSGRFGDAHYTIADLVAFASSEISLHPGEFMASGTVGDGSGFEHGVSLRPGDMIELEISGLGILRNHIVAAV